MAGLISLASGKPTIPFDPNLLSALEAFQSRGPVPGYISQQTAQMVAADKNRLRNIMGPLAPAPTPMLGPRTNFQRAGSFDLDRQQALNAAMGVDQVAPQPDRNQLIADAIAKTMLLTPEGSVLQPNIPWEGTDRMSHAFTTNPDVAAFIEAARAQQLVRNAGVDPQAEGVPGLPVLNTNWMGKPDQDPQMEALQAMARNKYNAELAGRNENVHQKAIVRSLARQSRLYGPAAVEEGRTRQIQDRFFAGGGNADQLTGLAMSDPRLAQFAAELQIAQGRNAALNRTADAEMLQAQSNADLQASPEFKAALAARAGNAPPLAMGAGADPSIGQLIPEAQAWPGDWGGFRLSMQARGFTPEQAAAAWQAAKGENPLPSPNTGAAAFTPFIFGAGAPSIPTQAAQQIGRAVALPDSYVPTPF